MSYATEKIRNIALLGHGSNGKTSLAESILYLTGSVDRLGKVNDGNSTGDYDSEETKRKISIYTASMFTEYKGCKINVLDTPGYFDFAGEVVEALRVADAGIIVCGAKDGLTVGAEKSWKYLSERNLPKAFYISKIDEENGDFEKCYNELRDKFGTSVCPVMLPIKNGAKVDGVIDLINHKAYDAKMKEIAIPASMEGEIEELRMAISESVAETTEELMEKYFEGEEFTTEEIITGLKAGLREHSICPVFCGSAMGGVGTLNMLDAIVDLFPSPAEGREEVDVDGNSIVCDANGTTVAIVYKTLSDQFGKFSFFKVLSGKVTADMILTNSRAGSNEKLGHIYKMQGKKSIEVKEVGCGDIGAVSKLNSTKTGDTLCDPKNVVLLKA